MPFHLHFDESDLLRCRFALSPLWETQQAVRTLLRPGRHGYHEPWLRRIRSAAAGLDLGPLWSLMPESGHNPDFLSLPPLGPYASFEEEIAGVRAIGPELVREDLALTLACVPGALDSPAGRAILDDPARAQRELSALLEQAWRVLVEPDWPRLRALLEADIAYHSRRLAAVGFARLLGELSPQLSWADSTLTLVGMRGRHSRVLGGQGLVLMPSVFAWPDVVSGYEPPYQPAVIYPARGIGGLWTEPAGRTPQTLARLLGRARADILCMLDEPAGTSALAHRLGLAPSSVSEHLSVLRAAGLLTSRRYGHQVLYERTPLGIALAVEPETHHG
ncbi:winged helix-turn-helix domain-containing protein [Streptomyces sp. NBC_00873]|uniref:ArsR/SmtB family transcription factor n=1 Tax=unclassified Streptomyces TaxID=2593676 RepID=UPI003868342B|nr:winged helix-turn-helix domain-containing protein [Streptomyces sp. NBC_00873]WTA46307.1 winged helix-turn-helix domain-containing protein [Streptomyces sp. NBC_00842]